MNLQNLNPHIINPNKLHRDEDVLKRLHVWGEDRKPYEQARAILLRKYNRATKLLSSVKGLNEACPEGLPLAYKLLPVLRSLKVDDPSIAKFGGVPDLSNVLSRKAREDTGPLALGKHIAAVWPRCGACHRPMRFVCQFSFGAHASIVHALTHRPSVHSDDLDHALSGVGFGSLHTTPIVDRWWYVFICPDSSSHFHNPNCDAHVFVDWRFSSDRANPKRQEVIDATKIFMAEAGEAADLKQPGSDREEGPTFPLKRIAGFRYGFDLDFETDDWDLREAADQVIEGNPAVFGKSCDYTFFGKPGSQQTERRPYCQTSYLGPTTMPAILNFTDRHQDMTYQIYGDVLSVDHDKLFCKVDASCT